MLEFELYSDDNDTDTCGFRAISILKNWLDFLSRSLVKRKSKGCSTLPYS